MSTLTNPVLAKLRKGQPSIGSWCASADSLIAELMASSGIEWVVLDIEHYPVDLGRATECIRAIEHGGAVPMVRLPAADPVWIKRYLDAGALGLLIPQVRTVDEVKQIVDWTRFPPLGRRPYGRGRAGWRYDNYLRIANDHVMVMVQIETPESVESLDDILKVEGIDGYFVGPTDLALSLGYAVPQEGPSEERDQLVASLGKRISEAGKVAGTITGDAKDVHRRIDQGYRFVNLLGDVFMIRQYLEAQQKLLAEGLKTRR